MTEARTWGWGEDAVDAEIDRLIERRAQEAQEQERIAEGWVETARRYNLAAAAERRREWAQHHHDLARLHEQLAAEHHRKALRLIDRGA